MIQGAGIRRVSQMRIAIASSTSACDDEPGQRCRTGGESRE